MNACYVDFPNFKTKHAPTAFIKHVKFCGGLTSVYVFRTIIRVEIYKFKTLI